MSARILVADTHESCREAFQKALGNLFSLVILESPDHIVEVMDNMPDLRLLFLGISEEEDIEAVREIVKRSKDVAVIAVAERRFEELAVEAVREGASGYIIQPFAANDVLSLVQKRT